MEKIIGMWILHYNLDKVNFDTSFIKNLPENQEMGGRHLNVDL